MINFEEITKEQTIYIDKIKIDGIRAFVVKALSVHGTKAKLRQASKVADIVWQRFESLNYISENAQQGFVDITIAAALLHNLFYNEDDITTLFKHRVKLKELAKEIEVDERAIEIIYEIIEAQLGEAHPIPKVKPTPNTPAATVAEAVWTVNTFKARV